MASDNTIMLNIDPSTHKYEAVLGGMFNQTAGKFVTQDSVVDGVWIVLPADSVVTAKPTLIIVESEKGILDTEYAPGEKVYLRAILPGDVVWAWVGSTVTVAIGQRMLLSAGQVGYLDPTPVSATAYEAAVSFCVSLEAITPGPYQRIKVMLTN